MRRWKRSLRNAASGLAWRDMANTATAPAARFEILISRPNLERIIAHAQSAVEVCGLIGGVWGERAGRRAALAEVVVPIPNIAAAPATRFEMSPRAMVEAITAFHRAGQDVVGVYHSHPTSSPQPSPTDIAEATWPDALYLIVGYAALANPEIGAWRIRNRAVEPAQLSVVDAIDREADVRTI